MSRGDTNEIVDHYETLLSNAAAKRENQRSLDRPLSYNSISLDDEEESETADFTPGNPNLRRGAGGARIERVELLDDHGGSIEKTAPETNLTVRVHVRYAKTVDNSDVGITLHNDVGLDVFSTSTALEKTPIGVRRAGETVTVDFTFRVPLKHGRYSVAAAVSRPEGKELDRVGVAAAFRITRPSDREAFEGMVHLPTRVEVFEPDRVLQRKTPG